MLLSRPRLLAPVVQAAFKKEKDHLIADYERKLQELRDEIARLKAEHAKASIRSKVEHAFHVVKNLFRHRKCRYKGLAKNTAQLHVLFAMANLVLSQRSLCAPYRTGAS